MLEMSLQFDLSEFSRQRFRRREFCRKRRVLALDPATACGFAHSSGVSGVLYLHAKAGEDSSVRYSNLFQFLDWIRGDYGVDEVVIEAVRYVAYGHASTIILQSEFQGVIKLWCSLRGINPRLLSPPEIKKHATGRGNAKKPEMIQAAKDRWTNLEIRDDNQADALWVLDKYLSEGTLH